LALQASRFIHNYDVIAAPLAALLKRDAFRWTDGASAAFNTIKSALTSGPVLIDSDASGSGFGTILHQGTDLIQHAKLARSAPLHHSTAHMSKQVVWL
jgi:hypothetical protein